MSAWAKPGVKCVCVDGEWQSLSTFCDTSGPKKDEVCTITAVRNHRGGVWVCIAGYPQSELFDLPSFRPLVSRTQEQDLSIFLPLLTDLPVGEDA